MNPLLVLAALTPPVTAPDYSFDPSTPASHAQLSRHYQECRARNPARNLAILYCLAEESTRQDKRLNVTYRNVMRQLGPAGRAKLRTSERAWIARRDAICARTSGSPWTGTDGDVLYAECILHEIVKRTIWLTDTFIPPSA